MRLLKCRGFLMLLALLDLASVSVRSPVGLAGQASNTAGLPFKASGHTVEPFLVPARPYIHPTISVQVPTTYNQTPLQFEINKGQDAAGIDYLSRGAGYLLELSPTAAVLTLQKRPPRGGTPMTRADLARRLAGPRYFHALPSNPRTTRLTFRINLIDGNSRARASGLDPLPGSINYIPGDKASRWYTNITAYRKVKYQNVYPGVDLIYFGNSQGRLEHDFYVAPGSDPRAIRFKYEGANALEVDPAGNLVFHTGAGRLLQPSPVFYQEIEGRRRVISGGYVIRQNREVGLQPGYYDISRPLVIDPTIIYSTYLGGAGNPLAPDKDAGNGVAVDAAGNIYTTGATNSLGRWDSDVYVRKFDRSGSKLLYATYLDSNGTDDTGFGIAVDRYGDAYVTGQFGDYQLNRGLGVLVAKLNPAGIPLYKVSFGADHSIGLSGDFGARVRVDGAGNAYVAGTTFSPISNRFQTTRGAVQPVFGGGLADAFVVKLNPNGQFVYSTFLGGSGYDRGWGIAVDATGHAYVIGDTPGNFPVTAGAFQTKPRGDSDVFVAKLNQSGSALIYSTYLGGNGSDEAGAIAIDSAGNAYLTGSTSEIPTLVNNFPVRNAFQPIYGGALSNAFVSKLNATGSALVYSSYMGGEGSNLEDRGMDIAADSAGYAYLTGYTETFQYPFGGPHFPIVNAFQSSPGGGVSDAFVTKLTPNGALVYSSYLGGNNGDAGNGIALGVAGTPLANIAFLTGTTSSSNFPITPNAFQRKIGGGGCGIDFTCPDAFVSVVGAALSRPTPTPSSTRKLTPTPTRKPTHTPTKRPTPTPSKRPIPTATRKPTSTATKKPTLTATRKPTPTASRKATATATKKPTPTVTKRPTATATRKPTTAG